VSNLKEFAEVGLTHLDDLTWNDPLVTAQSGYVCTQASISNHSIYDVTLHLQAILKILLKFEIA